MAPFILFRDSLAMAWLQQHYFCAIGENFQNFLREKSYQNTLQIAPFTNNFRELACLQATQQVHDYNLSLFLSFLRQNRNKTCPKLTKLRSHKKFPASMLSNPPCNHGRPQKFLQGGGASPKKGPHHEVKSSKKAPKNEKNVAKRPDYEEKLAKRSPIQPKKLFFIFERGGGRRPTLAPP